MKKPFALVLLALLMSAFVYAQTPQGISYQAVARDLSGNVLSTTSISLRISVVDNANGGTSPYVETHTLNTNQYGLFALEIGRGTSVSGSMDAVNWGSGDKWLKIEMDPQGGTNYSTASLVELMSVPYALYAANAKDGSVTNELITGITYDPVTDELTVTEAGADHVLVMNIDSDDLTDNMLSDLGNVQAANAQANEILKWNGTNWVNSIDEVNNQDIQVVNNILSITDGNSVDLTPYLDDTDDQQLDFDPTTSILYLEDGGFVDLNILTGAGINTGMTFNSATGELSITDGVGSYTVDLSTLTGTSGDNDPANEIQDLTINGNEIGLTGSNVTFTLPAAGPTGATGAVGAQGPQGADGVAGPTGAQGIQGPQGPQGLQGIAGVDGAVGPQGPAGATGVIGPQGPQGVAGDKYATSSTTNLTIGTGIQNLTIDPNLSYSVGQTAIVAASATEMMEGMVTAYDVSTGNLTVDVANVIGAGTFSAWNVNLNGAAGPQGPTGAEGNPGLDGNIGPAGPQGVTGPQGIQGPQGVTGATGAQGVAGPQGIQGIAGIDGNDGIDGSVGPQGLTGPQGLQGPAGPQGIQGLPGNDGADGAQGIQGPAGAIGPAGPQGIQGPAGNDGVDGIDGVTGPQGLTGPQGPAGPTGLQGDPGINGTDGAIGPIGPQGLQGPAGNDGVDGAQGPQGIQGVAGVDGADGATGPTGAQGIQGLPGNDGINGVDGATGPTGPQGLQGPAGNDGAQGPQGLTGAQGPQGLIGPQGAQGLQGPQGVAGTNGVDGVTGPTGPAGTMAAGSVNQTIRHDGSGWVNDETIVNTGSAIGVGTTSPDASAKLDVSSTDKGLLMPRMSRTERDAISNPALGLLVFNTDCNRFNFYDGTNWSELVAIGPPSSPTGINGPSSVCNGQQEVYFVNTVAGATDYDWTVPAGWTYTVVTSNIISVTSNGTVGTGGDITCTAVNGCLTSSEVALTVTITCP